jgi:hypothetical protein
MTFKLHNRAVIVVLILFISSPLLASDDYLWPLKIQPELTSKFCDYRAGHFHGGLDIRTEGRTGLPCYAIDDSYVYRVNTSFRGFGKALYLKLRDGRIAVFGHLSDFGLGLDDRILKGQLNDKKFDQDLYFTAGEFPVKKGQQVALTGASGGSAPHLHLDIRSSANNPLNPLEFGYNLKDNSTPQFDRLAIRYYQKGYNPADPCEIELLKVAANKASGLYSIPDTIVSDSYLALAVSGGDRAGPGFLYGFYGLKLLVDDSLIFQMTSDSLSFNTTRELTYVRDLELIRMFASQKKIDNDENIFYRLYVPPHAEQFFWGRFGDNSGVIPPDGKSGNVRKVEIIGLDENGNQSSLKFYFKSPELPTPWLTTYDSNLDTRTIKFVTPENPFRTQVQYRKSPQEQFKKIKASLNSKTVLDNDTVLFANTLQFIVSNAAGDYRFCYADVSNKSSAWSYFNDSHPMGKFSLYGSPDFLRVEIYSAPNLNPPLFSCSNEKENFEMTMVPDGPQSFKADVLGKNLSGITRFTIKYPEAVLIDTQIVLNPVFPGTTSKITSPDSTLTIDFNISSAYYPAYIFPSNAKRTTIYENPAFIYDLEPSLFLAHSQIRFNIDLVRLGLTGKKIGLYAKSIGGNWWIFIGKIDGGKLEANGFGIGELALIEDNDPPIISMVAPVGMIKSSMPTLSCVIKDGISGLALDGGITMTIGDAWVPADYDLNTDKFTYKVRTPLAAGKHKLEIKALDNQGNSITRTAYFTVTRVK